jgi:hypothetical protein
VGLGRGAGDRVDDGVDLIPFAQRIQCGKGHADFSPQGADDELAAAGRADSLDEFEVLPGIDRGPLQRLVLCQQVGEFGKRRLSLAGGDVDGECMTGTPKDLIVLTVETAFLTRSAGSIERTVASCAGW